MMAKLDLSPGYSSRSLKDKLGLKEGMKAHIIHAPAQYDKWMGTPLSSAKSGPAPWDFVHLFTNQVSELENRLFDLRQKITSDGMIWISWYKKSAGKPTEITEDVIRATCLPLGLVDIKVCAVSDDWSGLKLVIRKKLR